MSSVDELAHAYQTLWKNRQLDVGDMTSLHEAIRDDCLMHAPILAQESQYIKSMYSLWKEF